MAQFQTILGVVLIISAVIIIALSIYNLIIIGKARTDLEDPNSKLTDGEKKGAYGVNVVLIIIGLVLGVYGFILVLPEEKAAKGLSSLRGTRSVSGSVLSPSDI